MQVLTQNSARNFVETMKATPRPIEDCTSKPKPTTSELLASMTESEAVYVSAKEKKVQLTAKLNALLKEIEAAEGKVAQADAARAGLIERAVFEDVSSDDLAKADRGIIEAKSAETTLRAVHDATDKALKHILKDLETLKAYCRIHTQRFWGRVCDDLADELKTEAGEKVQRLWAAHLRAGHGGDFGDFLVRCLPRPQGKDVKKALADLADIEAEYKRNS